MRERGRIVIKTRLTWDNIKLHFSYSWWAYALMAVLLIFAWDMAYTRTEYEPPADKKLQITFVGDYVSIDVMELYEEKLLTEFTELEKVTVDNIMLDFTGEGDYSGYMKLQVVVASGEGDIYLVNRELLGMYGGMGAFEPLDALTEEGGALHGVFTEEELQRGSFVAEEGDGEEHIYGLPADRLYGLISQGVDTSDLYITMTTYTENPEYAQKAILWLCEQTKEERPAWMDDLEIISGEQVQENDELPQIG